MDIKKLESKIKKIKAKVASTKGEGSDVSLLRTTRKRLKRAQRKRRVLLTKMAKVKTQKKKEQTAG